MLVWVVMVVIVRGMYGIRSGTVQTAGSDRIRPVPTLGLLGYVSLDYGNLPLPGRVPSVFLTARTATFCTDEHAGWCPNLAYMRKPQFCWCLDRKKIR